MRRLIGVLFDPRGPRRAKFFGRQGRIIRISAWLRNIRHIPLVSEELVL